MPLRIVGLARVLSAGLLALALSLAPLRAEAGFEDATLEAGVDYLQQSSGSGGVAAMTGGAAVGDFDGDGLDDLFVTRYDDYDLLFRNLGDGTYEDATAAAGLDAFNLLSNGAAFCDLDNDGDQDLYVTTASVGPVDPTLFDTRHYLFINDGLGGFTEEGLARGAAIDTALPHFGMSVACGDYDRDGWLDLHVAEWRRDDFVPEGALAHARLLHNRGGQDPAFAGWFEDMTAAAGVALDDLPPGDGVDGVFVFANTFSDVDQDGWPDLVLANDHVTSRIFWNDGDGTFTDGTAAAGVGTECCGMGSTLGDYDGDGFLDWFVTAIYQEGFPNRDGNRLFRYQGNRTFVDETDAAGVRDGYFGWGAVLFDYDNDGDLDLTHTNGFPGATWNQDPMRFWRNDTSFVEISASEGIDDLRQGKGLLSFDYDSDGDLDLFVVNKGDGPVLYRNTGGNSLDWLRVRLVGKTSNRDGIGALIKIQQVMGGNRQVREVGVGSHFLGQSERTAHFGLGPAAGPVHRVRVSWPSGALSILSEVSPNQTIVVVEPKCGLVGIEPFFALPFVAALRRRATSPPKRGAP